MGLAVVTVAAGGLPIVESTVGGMPVTEATNGYGVPVTKVIGKPGLPVVFETIGVAAPFTPTSFGSASANVVLSNNNQTATVIATTADIGARSTAYKSTSGKYYFEVLIVATHSNWNGIGLTTAAGTYANMTSGGVNGGVVYLIGLNNTYGNGSPTLVTLGAVAGDTVSFAYDVGTKKYWLRKNSGNWNLDTLTFQNPATGVGGLTVVGASVAPAVCFGGGAGTINDAFTANFGASAFGFGMPAGFTGWPP